MTKKAVILNDTSFENHHGCELVMKNIHHLLKKNNIEVIGTNPTDVDWFNNKHFVKKISKVDIVIVNGEGTLHHAQPRAKNLITIGKYVKEIFRIPIVLINTTYQDNGDYFAEYIKYFDLIYVRDKLSQIELSVYNISSKVVPDLTYYNTYNQNKENSKNRIGLTDSVDTKLSEKLYNYSTQSALYSYLPTLTNSQIRADLQSIIRYYKFYTKKLMIFLLFRLGYKLSHQSIKSLFYINNYKEYIREISGLKLIITGRYHALCFAIQTLTPFVTIKSDYHKYEGMLNDIGIGNGRIVDDIDVNYINYCKFEKYEIKMIEKYLEKAPKEIEKMFRDIACVIQPEPYIKNKK